MSTPTTTQERIQEWFLTGEQGLSSKAIIHTHLKGLPPSPLHHPLDPSDLRRCILLLEQVPEAREAFPRLAAASPKWKPLVEQWDNLTTLLREESKEPGNRGSTPRTYTLMQQLLENAGTRTAKEEKPQETP